MSHVSGGKNTLLFAILLCDSAKFLLDQGCQAHLQHGPYGDILGIFRLGGAGVGVARCMARCGLWAASLTCLT